MSKKILLNIMLPATKKTYDFWVPSDMTLHDTSALVAGLLESREKNFFTASTHNTLMAQETGDLLDHNQSLESLGFTNGSQFVLV